MSLGNVVYLIDWSWYMSEPLPGGDASLAALFYADGTIRFSHECKTVDGMRIVCAPALQLGSGHAVVQERPLTVEPSVLCPDCGTHGFIRNGRWVPV